MRKLFFILSLVLSSLSFSALADSVYVGHCDGILGSTENGGYVTYYDMPGATIQEAVFLTSEMLNRYSDGQITAIHAGLAEGASAYPSSLTVWVRTTKEGNDIASGSMTPNAGWNTVALDHAVAIADYTDGLWIGLTYKQKIKPYQIIAFSDGDYVENSGWLAKNGRWEDLSAWGILPLEAVVESDHLIQRDLSFTKVSISSDLVKIGTTVKVRATVKNNALATAVNPVINYSMLDGAVTGSYTIEGSLAYRQSQTVSFEIPTGAITSDAEGQLDLELAWADGTEDEFKVDNLATFDIAFASVVFVHNMLVEEATGAWCGFCVRGIVGMREMSEMYPDQFIGIAIHNGDDYVVSAYDTWIGKQIQGYPSCLINRDGTEYDPNTEDLETAMQNMSKTARLCVTPSAGMSNGKLTLTSEIVFAQDEKNAAYKVVYVITEDQLPLEQKNYYSGGGYGEMGGFENMGSTCNIVVDEVARAVYPSPAGVSAGLPASVVKGELYTHSLTVDMPTVTDETNAHVIAIIIDSKTSKVVNAGKTKLVEDITGIQDISRSDATTSSLIYDLQGRQTSVIQSGLYLINGKMVMIGR